jgi:hypothetical protein
MIGIFRLKSFEDFIDPTNRPIVDFRCRRPAPDAAHRVEPPENTKALPR